ncbi:hypothetical protein FACS1894163_03920 [Spirochaetia bacterium]|nr:hypothetical protein FACS1894163_03920 [Spirochaetia bacterium]
MKTIIATMPMKKEVHSFRYPVQGNSAIEYDGEVHFGVNGVLARILEPKEPVKLLFIVTHGGADQGCENARLFREEFDRVTADKAIAVTEEIIEINDAPTTGEFEKLISLLIDAIGTNAEIIGDITFGSKPFPFILLCAINFAEMFKGASLLHLIYGHLDWPSGKPPCNPIIYDITPVYYIQKLIGVMEGRNPEEAQKMLTDFFAL